MDFEQWKAKEVARLLALVETERRYYQEMVASLPAPIVVLSGVVSGVHGIVYANRAFRQHFGLRNEELRRTTIGQILPGSGIEERIREAHAAGTPISPAMVEAMGFRHRISIVPTRNWDDETELETLLLVEVLGPVEEPLREPVLSADVPAVVWEADASTWQFQAVGGSAEELLGYPVDRWLSDPKFFEERILADDCAAVMTLYRTSIAQGGQASAEFRALTAAGEMVWLRETIRVPSPEPSAATDGGRIKGVITNITRRKELERQLLTAGRIEALHGIAGRLAHDLNNPLMIARGYAEELVDNLPPESAWRSDAEHVLEATGRLTDIAGQLNSYSRRSARPARRVDLAALFTEIEPAIAKAAGTGVVLELRPSPEHVHAAADADQLTDAILALASTAREGAADRTRLAIEWAADVLTEHLAPASLTPGKYARITLREDGRGLARGREFSLFETVVQPKEASLTDSALARAYARVREWGGDIAVSSMVGQGMALSVYLPYLEPEAQGTSESAVQTAPVEIQLVAAPPEPLRETILVVDDEAGIRGLVRKILKREHYQVLEAESAEEALTIAVSRAAPIHLLLTDVVLPGLSGPELARRMYEASPNLRVLYISGYTDDPTVKTGEFPPGSRFLAKPFTLSALLKTIRETLDAS